MAVLWAEGTKVEVMAAVVRVVAATEAERAVADTEEADRAAVVRAVVATVAVRAEVVTAAETAAARSPRQRSTARHTACSSRHSG